ncbi:hypothetical protein L7G72_13865 [Xenorhabdus bovienii]|uniref:hypothetical protein n=1 Tax=Xenorhabdus bovienii TaxID=40576 RepID=UPI001EE0A0BD|nr:hypothetical protein [Xenorhabdus bovienii]MCG3462914.1 hypothetical protein [Xenorhabdus bovienii]
MKYDEVNVAGWNILKVDILGAPEIISQAQIIAEKKAKYVREGDPAGRMRDESERISQNFLGALADISCTRLLRTYFRKHNFPIKVESYDEVRNDNFEHADKFDISLTSDYYQAVVEVRSSICIKKSLQGLINDWHILGAYQSKEKGNFETEKEFYIRPMFHLKRYKDNYKENFYRRSEGMQLIKNGEVDLYILGGATAEIMSGHKAWDEKGETLKQGESNFRVIYIKDGLQTKDFLELIALEMVGNNNFSGSS